MAKRKKLVITSALTEELVWPRIRVLGIDPSVASTGWSVVDFFPRMGPRLLGHGTVHTDPTGDMSMKSIIERSRLIFDGLKIVAEAWPVDMVAIELPVPSARGVGSQSGSIIVGAAYNAVPYAPSQISLHHPTHTKKVVTTNGKATKQEVKEAVAHWLYFLPRTNTDVTDSISASLTYALEHLTEQPDDNV